MHNTLVILGVSSRIETVVVGGTRQKGLTDTNISEEDKQEVWERVCRFMPSLRVSTNPPAFVTEGSNTCVSVRVCRCLLPWTR